MNIRKLLDWRKLLIYSHRWLGIVFGLLFVAWFISGVAFMYWGMPSMSAAERLDRQKPIDLSSASVSPAEAAQNSGIRLTSVRIEMQGDRPVYRMAGGAVYADTGEAVPIGRANSRQAVEIIRQWAPEHAATIRYDARLLDSDQWTLQSAQRSQMPLHRIAVGDRADTYYYVAERTGEIVMKTDRESRFKGFWSGVLHWVYFTPLRKHTYAWNQFIIWGSFAGAVMCLTGLAIGLWRLSLSARFRQKGQRSHSPYSGMMRWHHYSGLLFGLVTFTWIISGAFSVNPYGMFSAGGGLSRQQREVLTGGPLNLDPGTVENLRAGVAQISRHFVPKQVDVLQFRGELYLTANRPPSQDDPENRSGSVDYQMVWLGKPEKGTFTKFDESEMEDIAKEMMAGVPVRDKAWLYQYDGYYRSRDEARPLPVLRIRYLDERQTWLYLDPHRATITELPRIRRVYRWLYNGLHEFDFPFLYDSRPLWDIVVILLSIGGMILSATTLWPMVKRLRRHGRRLVNVRPVSRASRQPDRVEAD